METCSTSIELTDNMRAQFSDAIVNGLAARFANGQNTQIGEAEQSEDMELVQDEMAMYADAVASGGERQIPAGH